MDVSRKKYVEERIFNMTVTLTRQEGSGRLLSKEQNHDRGTASVEGGEQEASKQTANTADSLSMHNQGPKIQYKRDGDGRKEREGQEKEGGKDKFTTGNWLT